MDFFLLLLMAMVEKQQRWSVILLKTQNKFTRECISICQADFLHIVGGSNNLPAATTMKMIIE